MIKNFETRNINGVIMHIFNKNISRDEMDIAISNYTDNSDVTKEWFHKMIGFAKKHDNFYLGIHTLENKDKKRSMLYFVYELKEQLQVVDVGVNICEKCGWMGTAARHLVSIAYTTIPNRYDEMKKAKGFPQPTCPICGSKLKFGCIWVDNRN